MHATLYPKFKHHDDLCRDFMAGEFLLRDDTIFKRRNVDSDMCHLNKVANIWQTQKETYLRA
jgi:hypothetical protein